MKKILIFSIVFTSIFLTTEKVSASLILFDSNGAGGVSNYNSNPIKNTTKVDSTIQANSVSTFLSEMQIENKKLNDLITKVNSLEARIMELQSDIASIQVNNSNKIASIEARIKELESKNINLQANKSKENTDNIDSSSVITNNSKTTLKKLEPQKTYTQIIEHNKDVQKDSYPILNPTVSSTASALPERINLWNRFLNLFLK